MALSTEQIEQRRGKLTASRISVLMTGDAEKIMQLWMEMTNHPDFVPEDLSGVWAVRLGECTEGLNQEFYERKTGRVLQRCGEVVTRPHCEWAAATLDGFDPELNCPVECKHVGGREPLEIIIDRYQPQMQWQMLVTQRDTCALSVIMGANEPIVEYINADPEYQQEMLRRGEYFMMCVDLRKPPVTLAPVPPPVEADKIIDMTDDTDWQRTAAQWLQAEGAARTAKECEKILKAWMPPDCKRMWGCGIYITRDRAGRLSLRRDE
jgi:predicted phage-related endonuclease